MFRRITAHSRRLMMLLAVCGLLFISLSTLRHQKIDLSIDKNINYEQESHTSDPAIAANPGFQLPPSQQTKSPIKDHTRGLVIAKLKEEDTTWVDRLATHDPRLKPTIYVVDDPNADPFVIKNKGHEVMPYLTYIIDNYDSLHNITIFMHAHNATWHNNAFLRNSSEITVSRLNTEHVLRTGYMNLRCTHNPGCPDHIHPNAQSDEDADDIRAIPEAAVFGRAWKELFPNEPVPDVLAQPCCSQFAVSAKRIRATPVQTYVFWRDWVLRTPLHDRLAGRVWEYLWQYIFMGQPVLCPNEHECACQGYGVCSLLGDAG